MNERIQELAVEAGIISAEYNGFDPTGLTKAQRKFAELIVQECMSIIKQGDGLGNEDDFDKGFQAGIAMAYNRVRAQMGVEE